jgi:hypothetical protein
VAGRDDEGCAERVEHGAVSAGGVGEVDANADAEGVESTQGFAGLAAELVESDEKANGWSPDGSRAGKAR